MTKTFTFDQLTDSQKQIIAEKWCANIAKFQCETSVVEYILNLNDHEAPFNYEDIENNEPTAEFDSKHGMSEITETERNELLEFYLYLTGKWDDYLGTLSANLDDEYLVELRIDEDDYQLTIANAKVNKERLENICEELENLEFNSYPEVYQWFSCDGYTLRKLKELGQCVLADSYWGRQTYGQSIYLDHCIQQAAFNHYCEYDTDYISLDTIQHEKFDVSQFWGK